MANRKLIIEVVADADRLQRGLKKAEGSLAKFQRTAGTKLPAGALLGGGLVAGAALFTKGVAAMAKAARESEIVLGQTSVAVEGAGLAWNENAQVIEDAATRISKATSFDDEDVLKSFQVFVRGNRNVAKSIDLAALAADVARGRYTDLDTATQLVNKAAMGQVGALRRAGIQIDKTATSTEALAALQTRFAGAAEKYSKSSAGAADRLRVSWENLLEDLGSNTSNQVGQTQSTLAGLVDTLDRMVRKNAEVEESWQDMVAGIKATEPDFTATASKFFNAFGLGALTRQPKPPPAFGQPGFKPGKAPPVPLGATAAQRNQWFDAGITRQIDRVQDLKTVKAQVSALSAIATEIQKRINVTKDITRRLNLEDQLVAVTRQRAGLIAQGAEAKAAAAQAAAARQAARVQTRQFKALGLAAGGGDIVPGGANLRAQLESLTNRLATHPAVHLSSKLEAQLKGARKVLSGQFGKMTDETRAAIQDLFQVIRGEFDKGAKQSGGPLTKTTQLSTERILAGLGLGRDAERVIRARLSHFNSAGTALAGTGSGSMTINVPVVVDGKVVAATSAKYNRRTSRLNASQRNGPNAGGWTGRG